jgi:hypothetical protein
MKKIINFFQNGTTIGVMMGAGGISGFVGLDWDQSQIAWRAAASGWVMGVGFGLFGIGCLLLAIASND